MSAVTIARLKITLDAVKPAVLRRVEVPFDIRLDRLHLTVQAAMGWTNSHLYEIRAGDVGWSTLYPEADWPEDFLDARKHVDSQELAAHVAMLAKQWARTPATRRTRRAWRVAALTSAVVRGPATSRTPAVNEKIRGLGVCLQCIGLLRT